MVKAPAGANQVVSPDILDIIAIAFRPSGLRISCPTCPRSAPSAKLRCLPSLDLATPTRAGVRLPNSPSWRRSSPSTQDTHAPVPAVATSIVAGFPRRFAPTSSGHALAAAMSYFSGRHHLGRRAVKEVVETVFEAPTSLGSISALKAETCAALATPYQVAETSGAGLPASRNRGSSGRHSHSAITGPCWGLNGYATGGHFPAGVGHRSHASENPATYLHHEVVSKLRPTSQMRASHTGSYTLEFGKSLTTTHAICRRAQK